MDNAQRSRRVALGLGLAVAVVGALVVALIGSGAVRLDGRQPAAREPARIAVIDAEGGLSSLLPDGTEHRLHQVESLVFQFPAWSPEGSHLASIGHNDAGSGIFVFDVRSVGAAAPVAAYRSPQASPIYLYWSPGGGRIAFLTNEPDGLALQVVAADGSAAAAIVRRGQPLYWDWIDPSHLFVHSGADTAGAFIGEVAVDSAEVTDIPVSAGAFQAPAVSPDGLSRAYVITGEGRASRVVMERRDGSSRRELAVAAASALGWSPTGEHFAFSDSAQPLGLPVGPLHVIDTQSGATRRLVDGPVVAWFWSPDGRKLAVLRIPLPSDGQVAAARGSAGSRGELMAQGNLPALRLMFVDVRSGAIEFGREVRLSDLVLTQFVPFGDQYARSHRIWSPSSDAIVLPLQDETDVSHVTIVPADGSAERRIAEGVAAFWSP